MSPFSTFDEMNLPTVVLENVKRLSYKKPTPVQKYGSSVMDAQKDLMACAQNGTGKTVSSVKFCFRCHLYHYFQNVQVITVFRLDFCSLS